MSYLTQDSLYAGRTLRIGLLLAFVSGFGLGVAGLFTKELGHPEAARVLFILYPSVPAIVLLVAVLIRRRRLRSRHADLENEMSHLLGSLRGELAIARDRGRQPELFVYRDWHRRLVSLGVVHPGLAEIERLLGRAEREMRENPGRRTADPIDEAAESLRPFWAALASRGTRVDTIARVAWGASLLALFVSLFPMSVPLGVAAFAVNWIALMVLLRAQSIIVMAGGGFFLACAGFVATIAMRGAPEIARIWLG